MRRSSKKLPTDPNQLAAEIVRRSTEEHAPAQKKPLPSPISQYLSKIGRQGGLKGGKARDKNLSAKEKSAIGKKGAKVRWDKYRQANP